MSQGIVGANVEELGRLAGEMRKAADQLAVIGSQLSASPRHVWHGQDAARFFGDLDSLFLPQLRSAATGLANSAATLLRNADEQRVTSSAGSSGLSGHSGGDEGSGGLGSPSPSSGDQGRTGSGWRDGLALAIDVVGGAQAFAEAKAADAAGTHFWGFDPDGAPTKLGRAFEIGGYGLSAVSVLANLGAAADGDSGAMASVSEGSGSLLTGAAALAAGGSKSATALPVLGGALTVGADAFRIKEALDSGDHGAVAYHSVHTGVAAVGIAVPPVGLGLAAWDMGVGIGTAIGNSSAANSFYDLVHAEGVSQAGESGVADRYAGFAGVGNMARDGSVAAGKKITNLFGGQ